ncbi:hypothetical protein ACSBR2_013577 [Camellia fascicularis]
MCHVLLFINIPCRCVHVMSHVCVELLMLPGILILVSLNSLMCYIELASLFCCTCRLCDLVGFGVAIAAGTQFVENFPERTYKSMLIPIMQEDKRAGEATRKGFYVHNDKRKASPDPEIKKIVQKAREISGVNVDPKSTLVERAKSRL